MAPDHGHHADALLFVPAPRPVPPRAVFFFRRFLGPRRPATTLQHEARLTLMTVHTLASPRVWPSRGLRTTRPASPAVGSPGPVATTPRPACSPHNRY